MLNTAYDSEQKVVTGESPIPLVDFCSIDFALYIYVPYVDCVSKKQKKIIVKNKKALF